MYMAGEAVTAGRLPGADDGQGSKSWCAKLDQWLIEPKAASLIHGDMWSGNVLCAAGRITGLIDPAIYYADPEIELAFSTLFSTFWRPVFQPLFRTAAHTGRLFRRAPGLVQFISAVGACAAVRRVLCQIGGTLPWGGTGFRAPRLLAAVGPTPRPNPGAAGSPYNICSGRCKSWTGRLPGARPAPF